MFQNFCLEQQSLFLVGGIIYSQSFMPSPPLAMDLVCFFTRWHCRPMPFEHIGHEQTLKCVGITVWPVSGAAVCFRRRAGHTQTLIAGRKTHGGEVTYLPRNHPNQSKKLQTRKVNVCCYYTLTFEDAHYLASWQQPLTNDTFPSNIICAGPNKQNTQSMRGSKHHLP